jgi:hypothetical protein
MHLGGGPPLAAPAHEIIKVAGDHRMARSHSKPDFTAGVAPWEGAASSSCARVAREDGSSLRAAASARQNAKDELPRIRPVPCEIRNRCSDSPLCRSALKILERKCLSARLALSPIVHNQPRECTRASPVHGTMLRPTDRNSVAQYRRFAVLQLHVGSTSGQRWVDEAEAYCAATITERSFNRAGYDFLVRLVIVSATAIFHRIVDPEISAAWLEASRELGIRVIAHSLYRLEQASFSNLRLIYLISADQRD